MKPEVGKRVRLLAPMTNENSKSMPVEHGMPAGLEGTVLRVQMDGDREWHQIGVQWDNGRTLNLLPYADHFTVFEQTKKEGGAR
jgi:hypothetical protein